MEEQKGTVKTIKGEVPKIAYASAVHFSSPQGPMHLTAIGPDAAGPHAVDLPVAPDLYVLAYYTPFLDAFAHQEPLILGDYVMAGFAALGVTLGVLSPVLQRVERAARRHEVAGLRNDILSLLARHRPRQERTLYIDGTLFAADWTLPEDRHRPGRRDSEVLPGFLHEAFRSLNEEDDWRVVAVEEGDLDWRDLSPARGSMPGILPRVISSRAEAMDGRCRFTAAVWTPPTACRALSRYPVHALCRPAYPRRSGDTSFAGQPNVATPAGRCECRRWWCGLSGATTEPPGCTEGAESGADFPADPRPTSPLTSEGEIPLLVLAVPSVLRSRPQGYAIGCGTARHHASTGTYPTA
ncbi:hypothetical protein ABZ896_10660 [Streptomyces sp. NPDC047072]|uniref:hypothetical protein n=1 Tax=Streptomyces sp. NPDC047072 TaxID=3154809 RepID=UPI0033C582F7